VGGDVDEGLLDEGPDEGSAVAKVYAMEVEARGGLVTSPPGTKTCRPKNKKDMTMVNV
jgi:hypothetical protein